MEYIFALCRYLTPEVGSKHKRPALPLCEKVQLGC